MEAIPLLTRESEVSAPGFGAGVIDGTTCSLLLTRFTPETAADKFAAVFESVRLGTTPSRITSPVSDTDTLMCALRSAEEGEFFKLSTTAFSIFSRWMLRYFRYPAAPITARVRQSPISTTIFLALKVRC